MGVKFVFYFLRFFSLKRNVLDGDDTEKGRPLIRAVKSAWKRQRLIMNPTFSSAKLKEMGPLMVKCVDRLIEKLDKDQNIGEVNFHLLVFHSNI